MPLDENQLQELYALRKSQLPDYRDVVSFERVEIRDMWIKFGFEKVRDALRAIGLNGWRLRMLSKILDGSVNPDPQPTWQQQPTIKPQSHRIVTPQPPGNVGKISDIDLSDSSPEIAEIIRRRMKKGDLGDLAKEIE